MEKKVYYVHLNRTLLTNALAHNWLRFLKGYGNLTCKVQLINIITDVGLQSGSKLNEQHSPHARFSLNTAGNNYKN